MKINIFGSTKENYIAPQEEFNDIGGKAAGVCYLPHTLEDLKNESQEKTKKRVASTLASGHHSPYDHPQIIMEFIDIPKIIAMIINNENMYTTSEKSARYKKMNLPENEKQLYNKWLEIFKSEISNKYSQAYPEFFTPKKIEKLAQENARYLTSVFTPTSMIYSTTYRQFNNIIAFAEEEIKDLSQKNDNFSKRLKTELNDFTNNLKELPYYNEKLAINDKHRKFSLFKTNNKPLVEYFGDVYVTSYVGSFAQIAQAQRHRTLDYSMEFLDSPSYYIPPIIKDNPELREMWEKDCHKMENIYPQGLLMKINEMGSLDNFLLKAKERECTMAQLEVCDQTHETKIKMYKALVKSNHPRAEEMEAYMHGARCTFPDYTCSFPCKFKEGVMETRKI